MTKARTRAGYQKVTKLAIAEGDLHNKLLIALKKRDHAKTMRGKLTAQRQVDKVEEKLDRTRREKDELYRKLNQ